MTDFYEMFGYTRDLVTIRTGMYSCRSIYFTEPSSYICARCLYGTFFKLMLQLVILLPALSVLHNSELYVCVCVTVQLRRKDRYDQTVYLRKQLTTSGCVYATSKRISIKIGMTIKQ